MRKTPGIRDLQNEVVFTGNYPARTDDNGRLWIPKTLCGNPRDLETYVDLPVGRRIYLRKEDYGLYATYLTQALWDHFYYEKGDDDKEREDFFGYGKFVTIRNNGSKETSSKRITLGKNLAGLDIKIVGVAHFFKIIPDEGSLTEKGINWEDFELFSKG